MDGSELMESLLNSIKPYVAVASLTEILQISFQDQETVEKVQKWRF
jgi:hypothetical protein